MTKTLVQQQSHNGFQQQYDERRKEPRTAASGEVTLHLGGSVTIRGELLDVSPSGFRIRHQSNELKPGMEVEVQYPWGQVRARIMWARELKGIRESGFYILL